MDMVRGEASKPLFISTEGGVGVGSCDGIVGKGFQESPPMCELTVVTQCHPNEKELEEKGRKIQKITKQKKTVCTQVKRKTGSLGKKSFWVFFFF